MFLKLLIFAVLLGAAAVSSGHKFYRKDFTYVDQFNAFYKLHQSGLNWNSAFLACDDESSAFFYPKTKDEWTVVKALIEAMKHKPNVTDIFVGIHDEFGLGEFMTVDGLSTPSPLPDKDQGSNSQSACVTMEIDTGVYKLESCDTDNFKPFVCKKVEKIEPSCPTIDSEYIYYEETNKCYKFSQRKKSWTNAMQTCFMEGGILAVIKNHAEANIITGILEGKQLYDVQHFVGFRRLYPHGDFYTVKGQQFDNTFYKNPRDHNEYYQNDCGAVQRGDRLVTRTIPCDLTASFICEMMAKA